MAEYCGIVNTYFTGQSVWCGLEPHDVDKRHVHEIPANAQEGRTHDTWKNTHVITWKDQGHGIKASGAQGGRGDGAVPYLPSPSKDRHPRGVPGDIQDEN